MRLFQLNLDLDFGEIAADMCASHFGAHACRFEPATTGSPETSIPGLKLAARIYSKKCPRQISRNEIRFIYSTPLYPRICCKRDFPRLQSVVCNFHFTHACWSCNCWKLFLCGIFTKSKDTSHAFHLLITLFSYLIRIFSVPASSQISNTRLMCI